MQLNRQTEGGSLIRLLAALGVLLITTGGSDTMAAGSYRLKKTSFKTLKGWKADDHAQAFSAYLRSCARLLGSDTPAPRPGFKKSGKKHVLKAC